MEKVRPKFAKKFHGGSQFAIPVNGHTTQIVINDFGDLLTPNPLDLVQGLILMLGQELPTDLSLDNISFLVFLPSKANLSGRQFYPQFNQSLESIRNRCPMLNHLFLKGVSRDDVDGMPSLIRKLGLAIDDL
jgi:hypothetical protein